MRRLLSDPLPLRHTTEWPGYDDDEVIPWVFGRARIPARRYTDNGKIYVLADHALAGVDAVYADGAEVAGWRLRNGADMNGHAVAFIELAEAPAGALSADVRGLPGTIAAITNTIYPRTDLTDLNIWAAQAGIELGGALIEDQTLRAALQLVCDQFGGAWSAGMPGFAAPFPPIDTDPTWRTFDALNCADARADCALGTVQNRLTVRFDWDYAANRARQSLVVEAPASIDWLGVRSATLDLPWIKTARAAYAVAERRLQWRARALWVVQFTVGLDAGSIPPGGWVELSGPDFPVNGRAVVTDIDPGYGRGAASITAQIPSGPVPAVVLVRQSAAFDPTKTEYQISVDRDTITLTVTDEAGQALPGARVWIDDRGPITADAAAQVRFKAMAGRHVLRIESNGKTVTTEIQV